MSNISIELLIYLNCSKTPYGDGHNTKVLRVNCKSLKYPKIFTVFSANPWKKNSHLWFYQGFYLTYHLHVSSLNSLSHKSAFLTKINDKLYWCLSMYHLLFSTKNHVRFVTQEFFLKDFLWFFSDDWWSSLISKQTVRCMLSFKGDNTGEGTVGLLANTCPIGRALLP